jgi:hypothetical protein
VGGGGVLVELTVKVKDEVLVSDPPAAVTTTVEFPIGVVLEVEIERVVVQVGLQVPGESDPVVPVGRPETEKIMDCAVPEERVAAIVFVIDEPWLTDLLPPFETEKSKASGDGEVVPEYSYAPTSMLPFTGLACSLAGSTYSHCGVRAYEPALPGSTPVLMAAEPEVK